MLRLRWTMATLPDGSWAVRARGGWYAFDKKTMQPDFDRPVEVPERFDVWDDDE